MTTNYIGRIEMTGYGWAEKNSAQCNGQLMSIQQNQALFALLGTYYGGNGVNNFQLPDLRSRVPVGQGASADAGWQPTPYPIGTIAGSETVALNSQQMPMHNHGFMGNTAAGAAASPSGGLFAQAGIQGGGQENIYVGANPGIPLANSTVNMNGGNQAHENRQPLVAINFNIILYGVFPSRN
ncbi:MAG: tail fiber protein [Proteobacteria bacterium]|nr:tail fiber protein [Pseudomonadota bacterium]